MIVITSLKHNRCSRHRKRRPALTKCCCQRGSNCKQKSSRSQNSATISIREPPQTDGVGCTHHPTEEVSRFLLLPSTFRILISLRNNAELRSLKRTVLVALTTLLKRSLVSYSFPPRSES